MTGRHEYANIHYISEIKNLEAVSWTYTSTLPRGPGTGCLLSAWSDGRCSLRWWSCSAAGAIPRLSPLMWSFTIYLSNPATQFRRRPCWRSLTVPGKSWLCGPTAPPPSPGWQPPSWGTWRCPSGCITTRPCSVTDRPMRAAVVRLLSAGWKWSVRWGTRPIWRWWPWRWMRCAPALCRSFTSSWATPASIGRWPGRWICPRRN